MDQSQNPTVEDYLRYKRAMAYAAGAAYVDTRQWDEVMDDVFRAALAQLHPVDAVAMFCLGMFVAFLNDDAGLADRTHKQVDDLFPWSRPTAEVKEWTPAT